MPARRPVNDVSGTITAGGTSQQQAAENFSRRFVVFQNLSSGNLGLRFGGAATLGGGSLVIPPNGIWVSESLYIPTGAIHVIGATTDQAFTLWEA